jgi:hypothetical protein
MSSALSGSCERLRAYSAFVQTHRGASPGALLHIRAARSAFAIWLVMPGLVPGIHALFSLSKKDVDGRDKPGHDKKWLSFTLLGNA